MKPHEYVIMEIARERERQMGAEGWSLGYDDSHVHGELAQAAGCYALHAGLPTPAQVAPGMSPQDWPWDTKWWKPKDRRRDLVRAAALIVAELERLDRAAPKKTFSEVYDENARRRGQYEDR